MKILAVSDQVIDRLYSGSVKENYPDVDILIGCGDLPYPYLEFLVTIFNVPLYYVPGNHDPEYGKDIMSRAEGCSNLDQEVIYKHGLLIAGLGGSIMYHLNTPNQYTQQQMYWRVFKLLPKIWWMQLIHRRGLDLLITHSPPFGVHDDTDPAHIGLKAINWLIKLMRPRYLMHGHTIFYRQNLHNHISRYLDTEIVNVYPFRVMDISPAQEQDS